MAQITSGAFKTYELANLRIANTAMLSDANIANLKIALFTSAGNANSLGLASATFSDLTNEVAASNGYTQGGIQTSNPAVTRNGNTWNLNIDAFDQTTPLVEASGGSIVFRYLVFFIDATVATIAQPLLGVVVADPTPADVTVADGQKLTLTPPGTGFLIGTGANTD